MKSIASILFLVISMTLMSNQVSGSNTLGRRCDFRAPENRVACPGAFAEITQSQCEANPKCCFDSETGNVIWCFLNPVNDYTDNACGSTKCDYFNPRGRVTYPGAYSGINKIQCEGMGGCFDDQTQRVPYCFTPKASSATGTNLELSKPAPNPKAGF